MRAEDQVQAKIEMKSGHQVLDDEGLLLWSYSAGNRYDVPAPTAKVLVGKGIADLVEVGPQSVNGAAVPQGVLAKVHDEIAKCAPGPLAMDPAPVPTPEPQPLPVPAPDKDKGHGSHGSVLDDD